MVNVGHDFVSKVASLFTTKLTDVYACNRAKKKNKFQLVLPTNSSLILLACGSDKFLLFCNLINRHLEGKSTCSRQPSGTYF